MKYIIFGIGLIILVTALIIFNLFFTENQILKIVIIGMNIFAIVLNTLIIKNGFKIIKKEKQIELLKMWPDSN